MQTQTQSKPSSAGSTLILLLTALIWGVAFIPQVEAMDHMGSFTYGGVRFAMGTIALLPVILLLERKSGGAKQTRQTLLYGVIAGTVLFIASNLQQFGIAFTSSAGKSAFITGLYIILVPIFGIALRRRPPWLTWLGAISACVGLYFITLPKDEPIFSFGGFDRGIVVLLIGACFWALHILLVDHMASRVKPIRFSVTQFAVCALLSLASAFLFEKPQFADIWAGRISLLYGGLFSVGVAYTLQIVGQRRVEPARAAIIFSLESLFAALAGALFLKEAMGWKGWLGGGLMFLGIILATCGGARSAVPLSDEGCADIPPNPIKS